MRRIFNFPEYIDVLHQEILADSANEWFNPSKRSFIGCKMKFVNGNLDPYSFQNMSNHARLKNPRINGAFGKTLEFCNFVRELAGSTSPFGRMCIWQVPPHELISLHVDDHAYHRCVNRWCYFITNSADSTKVLVSDQVIPSDAGTLFEFRPAPEAHSFSNLSDQTWYFLSFDIWETENLENILPDDGQSIRYLSPH
jgi:hypothetical protein